MGEKGIIIAVDGPASSGKGTVSRQVAAELRYTYLDSGALYRVVALLATRRGVDHDAGEDLAAMIREICLEMTWGEGRLWVKADGEELGEKIRTEEVGQGASRVSKQPAVRAALLDLQRNLAAAGGVVMDGRDIGTVVFPQAELKIFLDANLEERARRRTAELKQRGVPAVHADIRADIAARDAQDSNRDVAPLCCAEDGVVIDTTTLTPEAATAEIVALARLRGA